MNEVGVRLLPSANSNQLFVHLAAVGKTEPKGEVEFSCCIREQYGLRYIANAVVSQCGEKTCHSFRWLRMCIEVDLSLSVERVMRCLNQII